MGYDDDTDEDDDNEQGNDMERIRAILVAAVALAADFRRTPAIAAMITTITKKIPNRTFL